MLFLACTFLARSMTLEAPVMIRAASVAMMRITTVNSISVKAPKSGDRPFVFAKATALGQGLRMYRGIVWKNWKIRKRKNSLKTGQKAGTGEHEYHRADLLPLLLASRS